MLKSHLTGLFAFIVFGFSTLELGSVTDGSYESNSSAFVAAPKPPGLDSLVRVYDTYLQHAIDSLKSPGAAVALVYKGEILLLKGYGVRKSGSTDTVDTHTAFRLGSVSKGFASILTGILVGEGSVDWDDRVQQYLADFRMRDAEAAAQMTIRNILSHTTGLPEHTYTDMLDHGFEYERIKGSLERVPVLAKPGQVYGYQNVAYSLIGDVLYKASGKEYNSLLQEKIFQPLNMQDASSDFLTFYNNTNTALPHLRSGSSWRPRPKNNRYYSVAPASGINASASDMAKWLLALTGYYPEVIDPRTIAAVSHPTIETPRKAAYCRNWKPLDRTYYSLGWRVFDMNGHDVVYHGGYVEGFRAEIAFDPDTQLGLAVLFNANTPVASACIPRFVNSFFATCIPAGQSHFLTER